MVRTNNPLIPMSVKPLEIGNSIIEGLNARNQRENNTARTEAVNKQADSLDRRTAIMEEEAKAAKEQRKTMSRFREIVPQAFVIKNLLNQEGGEQKAIDYLENRRDVLFDRIKQGEDINADDTMEILQTIKAGDMSTANAMLDETIAAGYARGVDPTALAYRELDANLAQRGLDLKQMGITQDILKQLGAQSGKVFDQAKTLRGEYEKQVADFRAQESFITQMRSAANTPQGDLVRVITLMKMLDPTSVVREGEQVMARKTGSIPDEIYQAYLSAKGEAALAPNVRKGIETQAETLFANYKTISQQRAEAFTELGASFGIPSDLIIMPNVVPTEGESGVRQPNNSVELPSQIGGVDIKKADSNQLLELLVNSMRGGNGQ